MPALLHLCLLLLFSARGSPAPAEGGNVTVYAALGDQAEFILYGALPNYNQTAHTSIEWRMNITINVANFRGSDRTCGDVYKHRCKGYKNGSLHLSNLSRKDSGYYNVDFYNDGKLDAKFWFLLEVQDPVSAPVVTFACHANETAELSCRSENGTRPEYSWTIEGNPLTANFNYSQNGTGILIKPQPVLRTVICTVKNQISERFSHPLNVTCAVPASTSGLTPMLSSTEPHTVNSTVEGKASDITTRPSKNTNTSKTADTCSNHQCFVVSAIWGATVLLVTGLALILGFLCTMPKE
ncbi:hepatocyte cell adhesion molecule-like isoform X5 [Rhinatrema bivittatum]|uniref:hepatocyte cell adhesion molecule-like isoform X5 n=1 Tax=Rhinatrema bivittatum TaxID=194408 RepID=UPI00112EE519|nr:hepatocyte cell adhesion molecule-like isoform X5 [Rhinatrema bivittatum]